MPALGSEIEQRVRGFWAEQQAHGGGRAISTRELHRRYCRRYGPEVGLSKFNALVRGLERAAPSGSSPMDIKEEWKPWADPQETAEDSAFLLRLDAINRAESGVSLTKRAAAWARRLRAALEGLHPYGQHKIAELYLIRDLHAYYLREELYTADLDGILVYRPWLPENRQAYDVAVASGAVPYPMLELPLLKYPDIRFGDARLGLGALVATMLEPTEYQLAVRGGGRIEVTPGITRVALGDDLEKGAMLDYLLRRWAGEQVEAPDITFHPPIH